jgi:hypothetical protein
MSKRQGFSEAQPKIDKTILSTIISFNQVTSWNWAAAAA